MAGSASNLLLSGFNWKAGKKDNAFFKKRTENVFPFRVYLLLPLPRFASNAYPTIFGHGNLCLYKMKDLRFINNWFRTLLLY